MKDLIEALTIFSKYTDARNPTNCDHDILTVCVNPAVVSADDLARLCELSFRAREDGWFTSYRFGSC